MPMYSFVCKSKKCGKSFDALEKYDATGKYPGVRCSHCDSKKKQWVIGGAPGILGPTKSKMDNFGYRAGHNLAKAKDCRRQAEAVSHMGETPYSPLDDMPLDTGIHENEKPISL